MEHRPPAAMHTTVQLTLFGTLHVQHGPHRITVASRPIAALLGYIA